MKTLNEWLNESENNNINTYIGKLFQSRDLAHLYHLATDKYAKHVALQEFYEGVLEYIDQFVEEYQGIEGIVELSIPGSKIETNDVSFFKKLLEDTKTIRDEVNQENLLTILDDLMGLISKTLYKLKELE